MGPGSQVGQALLDDVGQTPAPNEELRSLRDRALAAPLRRSASAPREAQPPFSERKAATALRTRLQSMLAVPRAYDLDRIDLRALRFDPMLRDDLALRQPLEPDLQIAYEWMAASDHCD